MQNIQNYLSQINFADIIWIAGAVILGFLAFKVAAKILKFLLLAVAVILLIGFLMSTGIFPSIL
jgi:hypothetical protein